MNDENEGWLRRDDAERQRQVSDSLIRIDERTLQISAEVKEVKQILVTKSEFQPVKTLVYGLVALIMTAVITALIAQVVVTR